MLFEPSSMKSDFGPINDPVYEEKMTISAHQSKILLKQGESCSQVASYSNHSGNMIEGRITQKSGNMHRHIYMGPSLLC